LARDTKGKKDRRADRWTGENAGWAWFMSATWQIFPWIYWKLSGAERQL